MSQPIPEALREAFTDAIRDVRRRSVRVVDPWEKAARPDQRPPEGGGWRIGAWITGRGYGKTRVLTEFAQRKARELKGSVGFVAGRTLGDVVRTLVRHPTSGLLATAKADNPCELRQEQGQFVVRWRNGSTADIHTSEEPDRARGPEYAWGIADEVATWKRVVDFLGNTTWANLDFALRGGGQVATPQMLAGTTPRRGSAIVKELIEAAKDPSSGVFLRRGSMLDNRENLPAAFIAQIQRKYGGTHLGRQEIDGELLPEVEGAIVTADMIEAARVTREKVPDLVRILVGVDPSGGRAEQGIVAVGKGSDGHAYVLADRSCTMKPDGWGRRAVELYRYLGGDRIIAERNFGGDMVESTIRAVDPRVPVDLPTASRGKHVRFEPVGALYEQGRVHHVGSFPELEDEIVCFTPDGYDGESSPNRGDALVWATAPLMLEPEREPTVTSVQQVEW